MDYFFDDKDVGEAISTMRGWGASFDARAPSFVERFLVAGFERRQMDWAAAARLFRAMPEVCSAASLVAGARLVLDNLEDHMCDLPKADAHLAAMKKEAIETFLKRKKETSAMKEAIEAAKAKKNEKSKTTGVTSLPPPKGVVGHSKKPTWVKVIEDDADEGEETDDIEEEQPKIKAILTSTDDDDVSSSASASTRAACGPDGVEGSRQPTTPSKHVY